MNIETKGTLYGEIIKNLKNELSSLTEKIKKTRENNDFGTYKNLILAYKEVLGLYRELVEGNEMGTININPTFNITKDIDVSEITDALYKVMNDYLKIMYGTH